LRLNHKLLRLKRLLQQEYGLQYSEAEMLADDVLVNIETLRNDLVKFFEAQAWSQVAEVGKALRNLGRNLELDDLSRLGHDVVQAAAARESTRNSLAHDIEAFLNNLTDPRS